MRKESYDIVIAGGGIAGLVLANLIAQSTRLSIAILESQKNFAAWSAGEYFHRVSAITLSSQRIFKALSVWDVIQKKRAAAFTQMEVWDSASLGEIHFDCKDIAEPVLGFIIENNLMQSVLLDNIKNYPQIKFISGVAVESFQHHADHIEISTSDDSVFTGKLAVAADGANSKLRDAAGIITHKKAYEQLAIVATVETSIPHQAAARQVFLNTGPLAFLPLAAPKTSSIVWSLAHSEARHLLSMTEEEFKEELSKAFSHRLGEVLEISERYSFPLSKQQTTQYVRPRLAIVGDAAHIIHPLAGQGVNIGILDAASLAEIISTAALKQRDFASYQSLRRYERWRKADNFAMLQSVDCLKTLFASDKITLRNLRGLGLNLTNRMPWIKNLFTTQAVGNRRGLPACAKL